MRGRPREPADLIRAKGKKHLSEEEYETRKNSELQVPFTDVEPPDYLNDDQKVKFQDIAMMLLALGIMTELDTDCLARYVLSHDLYLDYTTKLTHLIAQGDISELRAIQTMQDKAFKQAQSSARDLGLTITSRCKIIVPSPPNDGVDDEL